MMGGQPGEGMPNKLASALSGATTFKAVHRLNLKVKEFETKLNQIQAKTDSLSQYHLENFGAFSLSEMSKTISQCKEDLKQKVDSLEYKQTAYKVYTLDEEQYKTRSKLEQFRAQLDQKELELKNVEVNIKSMVMALDNKVKSLTNDLRSNYQEFELKLQQKNMYGMGSMSMGGVEVAETEHRLQELIDKSKAELEGQLKQLKYDFQRELGVVNAALPLKADLVEVESMLDKAVLMLQD